MSTPYGNYWPDYDVPVMIECSKNRIYLGAFMVLDIESRDFARALDRLFFMQVLTRHIIILINDPGLRI